MISRITGSRNHYSSTYSSDSVPEAAKSESTQTARMSAQQYGASSFECRRAPTPAPNDSTKVSPDNPYVPPSQDLEQPDVVGGTLAERKGLLSAHDNAEKMLDNAIVTLQGAKKTPNELVEKYFGISGTSPADEQKLDLLINKFAGLREKSDDVTFQIDHADPDTDGTAWTSYDPETEQGVGNIHVNNPLFSSNPKGEQSDVLIHELSHYYAGTDDHAYQWEDKFNNLTQNEKLDNADSFSNFAFECSPLELQKNIAYMRQYEANIDTIRQNRFQMIQC